MSAVQRPFAVATGASSGIGYELAAQFGRNGYDVLIVAENGEISSAAQQLSSFGTEIKGLQVDLAKPDGVEALYQKIQSTVRPVEAIAINAGVGVSGTFAQTELADHLNLINYPG